MQLILKSTSGRRGMLLGHGYYEQPVASAGHGITPIPPKATISIRTRTEPMISSSDLTRDIWGIPCGVECTREAQARWSHYTLSPSARRISSRLGQ